MDEIQSKRGVLKDKGQSGRCNVTVADNEQLSTVAPAEIRLRDDLQNIYALLFRFLGYGFRLSMCNVGRAATQQFVILVPDPIIFAPWSVLHEQFHRRQKQREVESMKGNLVSTKRYWTLPKSCGSQSSELEERKKIRTKRGSLCPKL